MDGVMTFQEWLDGLMATAIALPGTVPYVVHDGGGDATYLAIGPSVASDLWPTLREYGWEPAADGYLWSYPLPPKP